MMNMQEMQALINGSAALSVTRLVTLMQINIPYSFTGAEESAIIPMPALYGKGSAYTPVLMAGISVQSSQVPVCEDFIRVLFSPEVQTLETGEGMPASRNSFLAIIEDMKELNSSTAGASIRSMMAMAGGNAIEMKQPDDEHYDMLIALAEQLCIPVTEDETLMAFIVEETAAFFRGEINASAAQNALYHRTMAYLNE